MGEKEVSKSRWIFIALAQVWQVTNGTRLLALGMKSGVYNFRKANFKRTSISDQLGVFPN